MKQGTKFAKYTGFFLFLGFVNTNGKTYCRLHATHASYILLKRYIIEIWITKRTKLPPQIFIIAKNALKL